MASNKNDQSCPDKDEINKSFHPFFALDYAIVEGCLITEHFVESAEEVLSFEVKDDDVFVAGFPKCGTTWTQEMVWCIGNHLDFEKAKKIFLYDRFPFLELTSILPIESFSELTVSITSANSSLDVTKNIQGRRFIKTHLPLQLAPRQLQTSQRKAKVGTYFIVLWMLPPKNVKFLLPPMKRVLVYVARDPRDVVISYFHHCRRVHGYIGDFATFLNLFLSDRILYAPFWKHVLDYWSIRNEPNVLFITYEEMKRDLPSVIERVAAFLDKSLTAEQVSSLAHHLSFDSMKNNCAVNFENDEYLSFVTKMTGYEGKFMRSGESGVFLKDLTEEQIELLNSWCEKNLEGTDYVLPELKTRKN